MNNQDIQDEGIPPQDETRYIRLGWWVIGLGFCGFFLWAAFAPLDKGVSASGTVMVSGHRKVVQAPAHGVINAIHVKEGSHVTAGELLVEMNPVQAQAQLVALQEKQLTLQATGARLQAEEHNNEEIRFPASLTESQDPRVALVIAHQQQLFTARRQALASELNGYRHATQGAEAELNGLTHSLSSKKQQLATLSEQKRNLKPLADEGYLPRNRYLEIQNQHAAALGEINETQGRIGQLQQRVQELKQQIARRQADYLREVGTQLTDTRLLQAEVAGQLKIAAQEHRYTRITAPVTGIVVGLNVFTEGAVVQPGETLMEVVPRQQPLMVDARLAVNLVDKVHPGLPVELMFTAFNQNTTPRIPGTVTLVSADRLTDPATGESWYTLQIAVSPDGLKIPGNVTIKPGMPVELFVKTGERSLLSYLFKPLTDRLHLSLSEE